jgi:predicted nucleic acid-binding protein
MSYWDTSTLVKLYAQEPDSDAFENYALGIPAKPVTSRITLYEAHATFQRKEAEGILQPGYAPKLYAQLLQDVAAGELRLVELGADVEREYGQVLGACYQQSPPISLRTLDALHLASARVAGEN